MDQYPDDMWTVEGPDRPHLYGMRERFWVSQVAQKQPEVLPEKLAKHYEIDDRFGDSGYLQTKNGGKAVALRDKRTDRVIIGFSPKDNSEDRDDIPDGGKKQWVAMRPYVERYLLDLPEETRIEASGHSLGAGITQHALHDLYAPESTFKDREIKGYGFDGIGAAEYMEDPKRLNEGRMTYVMVRANDFHTVSGVHAGDVFYALEPAHKNIPVVGDVLNHTGYGVNKSFGNALERSGNYQKGYKPVYEQDTVLGIKAKSIVEEERLQEKQMLNRKPKTVKPAVKTPSLMPDRRPEPVVAVSQPISLTSIFSQDEIERTVMPMEKLGLKPRVFERQPSSLLDYLKK